MKAIGNLFLNNKIRAYNGDIVRSAYVGYATNSITNSGSLALSSINLAATPTAAIFFGGKFTTSIASLVMGFYASSGQNSIQFRETNAVSPMNTDSSSNTTNIYHVSDNTTISVRSTANVTSVGGGTVNTTFATTEALPNEIRALLLAATNADVTFKTFANSEVYVKSGLSFTPNLLIITGTQNSVHSFAIATASAQYSITRLDQTTISPANVKGYMSNAHLIRNTDFINRDVVLNSINADGYTMTRGSASTTTSFCILALRIVGTPVIGIYDTPTTTGDHLLNLGHLTIDHLIIATGLETINSAVNTTAASGISINVFNGETEYSYGIISRDNVTPSQAESYYSNKAIQLRESVGTDLLAATVVELTASGPILNWTAVGGAAKKMIVLGIYY